MARIVLDSDDIAGLAKALQEALKRKGIAGMTPVAPPRPQRTVVRESAPVHSYGGCGMTMSYGCGGAPVRTYGCGGGVFGGGGCGAPVRSYGCGGGGGWGCG